MKIKSARQIKGNRGIIWAEFCLLMWLGMHTLAYMVELDHDDRHGNCQHTNCEWDGHKKAEAEDEK